MKQPKILIGCPTYKGKEYALEKYLVMIKSLGYKNSDLLLIDNSDDDSYYKKLKSKGIDVVRIKKSNDFRQTVAQSRNILRKRVLDNGYDYLFSLEQDLNSPSKDALSRLLSHNKKVISGIYFKKWDIKNKSGEIIKKGHMVPLAFPFNEKDMNKMQMILDNSVLDKIKGLIKIRSAGLGCCLIHRDVLEKVKFRTEPGKNSWDDVYFFTDVYSKGFDAWADPAVRFQHDESSDLKRKSA